MSDKSASAQSPPSPRNTLFQQHRLTDSHLHQSMNLLTPGFHDVLVILPVISVINIIFAWHSASSDASCEIPARLHSLSSISSVPIFSFFVCHIFKIKWRRTHAIHDIQYITSVAARHGVVQLYLWHQHHVLHYCSLLHHCPVSSLHLSPAPASSGGASSCAS